MRGCGPPELGVWLRQLNTLASILNKGRGSLPRTMLLMIWNKGAVSKASRLEGLLWARPTLKAPCRKSVGRLPAQQHLSC